MGYRAGTLHVSFGSAQHSQIVQRCQASLPASERTVTFDSPPNTCMFDIPPSGRGHSGPSHHSSSGSTSSLGTPPIIINLPESLGLTMAPGASNNSPMQDRPSLTTEPSEVLSDPADYADKPWPTLTEFLLSCQEKDRHHRDFLQYSITLETSDLLGPDDIEKQTTTSLQGQCDISLGAAQFLLDKACRVCNEVKAGKRAAKRRRLQ